ncbi:cytochrome P450 [Streptomyces sp. NPDC002574]|uniref:cytochrome P450 n=1 Tax=Streptomyces sp. NPDC002574 TaxID=3364652 RepID=UPI0036AE01F5
MEELAPAAACDRQVVYAPQIQELLARTEKVFRVDETTVGVSDPDLMSAVVAARPVLASERSVFKPAAGADIHHESATGTIRALGQDVAASVRTPPPPPHLLAGAWPDVATSYLRRWLYASDALPVSLLSKRGVTRSDSLSKLVDQAVAVWPGADSGGTALAQQIRGASSTRDRKQAIALYRRASATLCDGVAALAANALWLMNRTPTYTRGSLTPVLWETLRLLPPAWMLFRTGGEAYTALHPAIGPGDDIAMFPLLMHRDPQYWSDPLVFRAERWSGVSDPERTPGFMPFGFDGARCWARHLVVPLAERLLEVCLENGVTIGDAQRETHIPLRSLLSVRFEAEVRG